MSEKRIEYYDSYREAAEDFNAYKVRKALYTKYVLDYIKEKHKATFRNQVTFNAEDWKVVDYKSTPQQNNGYDCGIAVLMFIEAIMKGNPVGRVNLEEQETLAYRKRILQIIKSDYEGGTVSV